MASEQTAAVTESTEAGGEEDAEGICEVEALTPDTTYAGGLPAGAVGRARYRCTKGDGVLKIRLRVHVPGLPDQTAGEAVITAPKSSGWSAVFKTSTGNCSAYGRGRMFHTDATHGPHRLTPDGDDKSSAIPACG
jgi:hypothetical protein